MCQNVKKDAENTQQQTQNQSAPFILDFQIANYF